MFGYIYCPAPRFAIEEIQVAGVPFLQVSLPERRAWRMRWLVRRSVKALRRHGCTQAVFPARFPWLELFTGRGIQPASDLALRRAVAVETLLARLTAGGLDPRHATVAVLAPSASSTVGELLRELSRKVRYLKLWAGGGGEELAHELRWEAGVAMQVVELRDLCRGVQGAVLLQEPPEGMLLPEASVKLWEGSTGDIAAYFPLPHPAGEPAQDQLLGALFAAGRIKKEDFSPPARLTAGEKNSIMQ